MYQILIIFQVLVGLGIIGLVMIQQGKGADAGAAFGSGASGTVFGAQGSASFLSRATAILAAIFFITCLGLAVLAGHRGESSDLMDIPEIEGNLIDVPLQGDSAAPMSVPSIPKHELNPEDIPSIGEMPGAAVESEALPETVEEFQSIDGEGAVMPDTEAVEIAPEVVEIIEESNSLVEPVVDEINETSEQKLPPSN